MSRFRRELLIGLAVFVPIFVVIVVFRPTSKVTFLDLRIVNDTHRTVAVQPCWDLDCIQINGLDPSVVRPGGSVHSTGLWPTDAGHVIVVGIRKPGGNPREFSSCIVTTTAPAQQTGVARVSHGRPCFTGYEP